MRNANAKEFTNAKEKEKKEINFDFKGCAAVSGQQPKITQLPL